MLPVRAAADEPRCRIGRKKRTLVREMSTDAGLLAATVRDRGDAVETAIPWSGFLELERKVKAATLRAIRETTGREGSCTVRFTHLYPDGPAP